MSLNKRIRQIAIQTVKPFIGNQSSLTKTNAVNGRGIIQGQIMSYESDSNTYTVQFTDGSIQSGITPGSSRVIGPGDGVTVYTDGQTVGIIIA